MSFPTLITFVSVSLCGWTETGCPGFGLSPSVPSFSVEEICNFSLWPDVIWIATIFTKTLFYSYSTLSFMRATKPDLFTLNYLHRVEQLQLEIQTQGRIASSPVVQASLGKAHVKIPHLPDLERELETCLSAGVPFAARVRAAVLCVEDGKL